LLQQFDHPNQQRQQMRKPYSYSYGVRGYSRTDERIGTSYGDEVYLRLLHELTIFLKEKSIRTPLDATSKKTNVDDEKNRPISKKPKSAVSEASINCSMYEAERLLRDMASILSDTQPPSNFVVYGPNSNTFSDTPHTTTSSVPPLFDGSVANATPPVARVGTAAAAIAFAAAAGGGIGNSAVAGGGAGTILHLACALDVPLCLAFVLSMGADARACHTAFRRLLIHEAACNGSINCLRLLLELGQHYDNCFHKHKKVAATKNDSGLKSPAKPADFPFNSTTRKRLVHRQESGRSESPTLSLYRDGTSSSDPDNNLTSKELEAPRLRRIPYNTEDHNLDDFLLDQHDENDSDEELTTYLGEEEKCDELWRPLDFVSSLRLFRDLSRQVEAGTISELDAARKVMFHATVPDVSRHAIAKSCTYQRSAAADYENGNGRINSNRNYNHPLGNNSLWRLPQANSGRSDGHGNTPLHWAAFKNETDCVKLLLQYNADPDARANPSGWTPLHDAAYSNGHEAIRLLLDNGAHVDSRANSGATPLCFAAQEDAAEAAALLLERGADLTIRCAAAYNNSTGGDNQPPVGSMSRFSGYTPLHYCAHYNAKNAARILLQHPNAKEAMEVADFNERLPIHVAVARGSSDVLRELLRAGARVETRTLLSQNSSESENGVNVSTTNTSTVLIITHDRPHLVAVAYEIAAILTTVSDHFHKPRTHRLSRPLYYVQ
jgi:ankyrin repeat protein